MPSLCGLLIEKISHAKALRHKGHRGNAAALCVLAPLRERNFLHAERSTAAMLSQSNCGVVICRLTAYGVCSRVHTCAQCDQKFSRLKWNNDCSVGNQVIAPDAPSC